MKTEKEIIEEVIEEEKKLGQYASNGIPIERFIQKALQSQAEDEIKFWSNFIKDLNSIPDIANLKEDSPNASFFHSQGYNKLIGNAEKRLQKLNKIKRENEN